MTTSRKRISLVLLLAASGGDCLAQELRCNQMFMNASEKRICGTATLMDLDKQIGALGRRAAMHLDSFKSDQREFRKALKTCDGNEECLTSSYQNRIAELQAYIATLPPPTDEEVAKLTEAGEKAEAKRDAQADTRKKIAERLVEKDAEEQVDVLPIDEQAHADVVAAEPVPEEAVAQEAAHAEETAQIEKPATATGSGETGWGGIAFMGALMLGGLALFKSWLNRAVRRCPGCRKWFAGKVIDSDREAYTDYETKTFEDVHRDRNYAVTGRTTKQRQVKVRVTETTNYYQCIHCDNKWAWTSTSRSS